MSVQTSPALSQITEEAAPPQNTEQEQRLQKIEQAIQATQQAITNIAAYLDQQTTPQTQQQGQPPPQQQGNLLAQLLPTLLQAGLGHEEDPYITAMKQKSLAGMDLQNQLTQSFISVIPRLIEKGVRGNEPST